MAKEVLRFGYIQVFLSTFYFVYILCQRYTIYAAKQPLLS